MADNLGIANLKISVDLEKFSSELKAALNMVKGTLNDMGDQSNLKEFAKGLTEGFNEELKKVSGSADEAATSVDNMGASAGKTLTSFAKFELIAGVIDQVKNAFGQLKTYVTDLVTEYADAELVQDKLRMGLERLGSGNYFDRLKQQADELHKITPFDDNDITNMQAMMTTFDGISGAMIERLTPSLLNLSSAFARAGDTGMNLQQVAIMVGKSGASEISTGLQRVGIVMTETEKSMWGTMTAAERFSALEEILARNSNITAEAFGKTLAGQMKITENAFGDITETIGKAFAPLVVEIGKAVQALSAWFQELSPAVQAAVGVIGLLIVALTALAPVLAVLGVELGGIPILIGALVAAVAGIAIYISDNIDSIKAWVTEMAGGEEAIKRITDYASSLWEALKDLGGFISDELSSAFTVIISAVEDLIAVFRDSVGQSNDVLSSVKTLIDNGLANLRDMIQTVIGGMKLFIEQLVNVISSNSSLKSSLGDGSAWQKFSKFINDAAGDLNVIIGVIMRVASVLMNLQSALDAIRKINIANLILDPSSFEDSFNQFRTALVGLKDSLTADLKKDATNIETIGKPIGQTRTGEDLYAPAYDRNGNPIYQDQVDVINKKYKKEKDKDTDKSPSGKTDSDTEKEQSALQEIMAEYEYQVKLMDDKVKLGEKTVQQQKELYAEYQAELEARIGSLTKTEDVRKAEEKIYDLKTKQQDIDAKLADEQAKLEKEKNATIADVDKFIEKRRGKILDGIAKETADIEANYKAMEDKVTASKLTELEKQFQYEKLNAEKEKELADAKLNSEKSASEEIRQLRIRNSGDEYALAIDTVNRKYEKEKERINKTYADGVAKDKLLRDLEIAHIKEVEGIHTQGYQNIAAAMQSGFSTVMNVVSTSFSQMWVNIFGEARTLLEQFVQAVISQLAQLAASKLFTGIIDVLTGGVFGIFGELFGGGGYTGDGNPDEAAGIVHKKEYVVNEAGTSAAGNRAYLDIMNTGASLSEYIRKNVRLPEPISFAGISAYLPSLTGTPTGSRDVHIHIDGINTEVKKLTGLQDGDWSDIVDEVLPHISGGLKRIGKSVLDNQIK